MKLIGGGRKLMRKGWRRKKLEEFMTVSKARNTWLCRALVYSLYGYLAAHRYFT